MTPNQALTAVTLLLGLALNAQADVLTALGASEEIACTMQYEPVCGDDG
ncbi:MAG: hypothetical protein GY949_01660, partial [Gammaproteobacteria bacterium]|nr:hypothetical protein [Gammaproteobacteria bacterium]